LRFILGGSSTQNGPKSGFRGLRFISLKAEEVRHIITSIKCICSFKGVNRSIGAAPLTARKAARRPGHRCTRLELTVLPFTARYRQSEAARRPRHRCNLATLMTFLALVTDEEAARLRHRCKLTTLVTFLALLTLAVKAARRPRHRSKLATDSAQTGRLLLLRRTIEGPVWTPVDCRARRGRQETGRDEKCWGLGD